MPDHLSPSELLEQNIGRIERITASLTRRHGLSPDEAEDFDSWVKMRLVEDDYAILRKYRGESSILSYIAVVISMLFRDYRVSLFGRWRPSAAATRRGPLAVRLETLLWRDGFSLTQAIEVLRASEPELEERELVRLAAELPPRAGSRPVNVGSEPLEYQPATSAADAGMQALEARQELSRIQAALTRALDRLPPEDRLILRMRYSEGMSIGDIARALNLDQKPLYRRLPHLTIKLRALLEEEGIDQAIVRQALDDQIDA